MLVAARKLAAQGLLQTKTIGLHAPWLAELCAVIHRPQAVLAPVEVAAVGDELLERLQRTGIPRTRTSWPLERHEEVARIHCRETCAHLQTEGELTKESPALGARLEDLVLGELAERDVHELPLTPRRARQ